MCRPDFFSKNFVRLKEVILEMRFRIVCEKKRKSRKGEVKQFFIFFPNILDSIILLASTKLYHISSKPGHNRNQREGY